MSLKFYRQERSEFSEFYQVKITEKQADRILDNLSAHFKLPRPGLIFVKMRGASGRYAIQTETIKIDPGTSNLGVLVHEFGHHMDLLTNGRFHHVEKTVLSGGRVLVRTRMTKRRYHTKAMMLCMVVAFQVISDNSGWGLFGEIGVPDVRLEKVQVLRSVRSEQVDQAVFEASVLVEMDGWAFVLVRDLVEKLGTNYQKMGAILRGLEKRGFVERQYHGPSHLHLWELTERGRGRAVLKERSE